MSRVVAAVLFVISWGCTSGGSIRSDPRLERFEAFVDIQQISAPRAHVVRAAQSVLAEHGWTPTEPGVFAGRIVVKGTPRRAAVINARLPDDQTYVASAGCRVDIFPKVRAHELRVTCHGQRPVEPGTAATALPQRVEWQDRYMAAHIIERVNRAQGQRLWRHEPTGQRTWRCARYAARGAGVPPGCVGAAAPVSARSAARGGQLPARRPIVRPRIVNR